MPIDDFRPTLDQLFVLQAVHGHIIEHMDLPTVPQLATRCGLPLHETWVRARALERAGAVQHKRWPPRFLITQAGLYFIGEDVCPSYWIERGSREVLMRKKRMKK